MMTEPADRLTDEDLERVRKVLNSKFPDIRIRNDMMIYMSRGFEGYRENLIYVYLSRLLGYHTESYYKMFFSHLCLVSQGSTVGCLIVYFASRKKLEKFIQVINNIDFNCDL